MGFTSIRVRYAASTLIHGCVLRQADSVSDLRPRGCVSGDSAGRRRAAGATPGAGAQDGGKTIVEMVLEWQGDTSIFARLRTLERGGTMPGALFHHGRAAGGRDHIVKRNFGNPTAPEPEMVVQAEPGALKKMIDLTKADQAVRAQMQAVKTAQAMLAAAQQMRARLRGPPIRRREEARRSRWRRSNGTWPRQQGNFKTLTPPINNWAGRWITGGSCPTYRPAEEGLFRALVNPGADQADLLLGQRPDVGFVLGRRHIIVWDCPDGRAG